MRRIIVLTVVAVLSFAFPTGCAKPKQGANGEITGKEKQMQKEMMMKAKGGRKAVPGAQTGQSK